MRNKELRKIICMDRQIICHNSTFSAATRKPPYNLILDVALVDKNQTKRTQKVKVCSGKRPPQI